MTYLNPFLLIICIIFVLYSTQCIAQQSFVKATDQGCWLESVVQSPDSNYIIAGQVNSKAWLMKMDTEGNVLWSKTYTTDVYNYFYVFYSLSVTYDSCLIASGACEDYNDSVYYAFCAKLNIDGDTIWTRAVNIGKKISSAFAEQTFDGGYILLTDIMDSGFICVKFDSDGNIEWTQAYNDSTGFLEMSNIYQTSDSGYIIAGDYMIKLDKNGSVEWAKNYYAWIDNIVVNSNGYMLPIRHYSSEKLVVINTDLDGNVSWCRDYSNYFSGPGDFNGIIKKSDSVFLLHFGSYNWFSYLFEIDAYGNVSKESVVAMMIYKYVYTYDSGYISIGYGPLYGVKEDDNSNKSDYNYGIVKIDTSLQFGSCYNNQNTSIEAADETLIPVSVSINKTPYLTAYNIHLSQNNYTVSFINRCVEFYGEIQENSLDINDFHIYPNPSVGLVYITNYQLIDKVLVYDMKGSLIFNSEEPENFRQINLNNYSDGIYNINIFANNNIFNKKIIINK